MASRSMLWLCGWAASWWKPGGPREAARSRARCQKKDVEVELVRLTLPSAMDDVLPSCCGGVQLPSWQLDATAAVAVDAGQHDAGRRRVPARRRRPSTGNQGSHILRELAARSQAKCHIAKAPLPVRFRACVTSGAPRHSSGLYSRSTKKPSNSAGSIVPSASHMCLFCDATLSILYRRSRKSLKLDQSTIPGDAQRSRGTFS